MILIAKLWEGKLGHIHKGKGCKSQLAYLISTNFAFKIQKSLKFNAIVPKQASKIQGPPRHAHLFPYSKFYFSALTNYR